MKWLVLHLQEPWRQRLPGHSTSRLSPRPIRADSRASAAADCPGRGFLATRSDCDRSTRAALPAVPFAAGSLPAAGGGSGAFFFRPVPYLLSVSGRENAISETVHDISG